LLMRGSPGAGHRGAAPFLLRWRGHREGVTGGRSFFLGARITGSGALYLVGGSFLSSPSGPSSPGADSLFSPSPQGLAGSSFVTAALGTRIGAWRASAYRMRPENGWEASGPAACTSGGRGRSPGARCQREVKRTRQLAPPPGDPFSATLLRPTFAWKIDQANSTPLNPAVKTAGDVFWESKFSNLGHDRLRLSGS
jgi:hypothetical protein